MPELTFAKQHYKHFLRGKIVHCIFARTILCICEVKSMLAKGHVSTQTLAPNPETCSDSGRSSTMTSGAVSSVDVRVPGKRNSNFHGARPVHLIIMMIKWIRTSRLAMQNSLSLPRLFDGGMLTRGTLDGLNPQPYTLNP